MTDLTIWIKNNNYNRPSDKVKIPSHFLLDGGKLFIPRSKEHDFLQQYAKELEKGSKNLYYVENRPNTYKFMMDIDISDDHYWTIEEIIELTKFIQSVVRDFFKEKQTVICVISPGKMKNDKIHTGVHLIWSKIVVDSQSARIIRRGVVQKLNSDYGPCTEGRTWEETIDERVYTRNGYRMVGSDKMTNKIAENRHLVLGFVMSHDGDLKEEYFKRLQTNHLDLISETSIRYVLEVYRSPSSKGMTIIIPPWLEADAIEMAESKNAEPGEVAGYREVRIIEGFIKTKLPKAYAKDELIKAVTIYKDGNMLVKTNSKHCLNIGREHNSCGIYFLVTPDGIYQKCLCPCDNLKGRKKGYCHSFTSEIFKFDETTRDMLFPNSAKKMFEDKKNKFVPGSTSEAYRHELQKEMCKKMLEELII